jgi:hypothetical protein
MSRSTRNSQDRFSLTRKKKIVIAVGLAIALTGGGTAPYGAMSSPWHWWGGGQDQPSAQRDPGVTRWSATPTPIGRPSWHKPAAKPTTRPSGKPTAHPTPTKHPSVTPTSRPPQTPSATVKPTPTRTAPAAPQYGGNVDKVDAAPPKLRKPGPLPKRPAGEVTAIAGRYENAKPGYIGGKYVMMRRGENVTLKGRGYLQVRYEIAWFNRPGSMVMPTWTGLKGKLFHVASGGLRRMDDAKPGQSVEYTWMGQPTVGSSGPSAGYVQLPAGAQQMWQNEFFYLDGEVTLTNHERGADYNITATPKTWDDVTKDITTPPSADPAGKGWVRYGLVRDTGDETAPVPQYATRLATADPAQVPQTSNLR